VLDVVLIHGFLYHGWSDPIARYSLGQSLIHDMANSANNSNSADRANGANLGGLALGECYTSMTMPS